MGKSLIITTGGGTDTSEGNPNITADAMLRGYTAYNAGGEIISGRMEVKVPATQSLNPGGSTIIPKGFHNGTKQISATNLSTHTSASADAGHILWNYTGWKNGSKLTGTMANKGTTNGTLSANGTYTIPRGWHNGSGKVTQSLTNKNWSTITPTTWQQTVVDASRWVTGDQIVVGDGNLVPWNIRNGITIFGITGNYEEQPPVEPPVEPPVDPRPSEFTVQNRFDSYSNDNDITVYKFKHTGLWTMPDCGRFPVIDDMDTLYFGDSQWGYLVLAFSYDSSFWSRLFITGNIRNDGRLIIRSYENYIENRPSDQGLNPLQTIYDSGRHGDRFSFDKDVGWIWFDKGTGTRCMELRFSKGIFDFFALSIAT